MKVADAVSVSAVIPVEGSSKLLVLVGNRICFMDRESGMIIAVNYTESFRVSPCIFCSSCFFVFFILPMFGVFIK